MTTKDDDFAALFEASTQTSTNSLKAGQRVKGTIVALADDTVFVDVGARLEARVARSELTDKKGELTVQVGDPLTATVVSVGKHSAPVLKVALGRGEAAAAELELAEETGAPVEGEFTKAVKGGLEVDIAGMRAFCPASQVDVVYVADLETFVGQRHFFKVIEIRDKGRSIVLSRKALLAAEREAQAKDLLARLEVGVDLDALVQSLTPYGAFVDIGGIQGLVHVSEISHSRVSSPADVLSVGESVRVKVLTIESNAEGKPPRISLSMKALTQPTAGDKVEKELEIVSATVIKVEQRGVLVESPSGPGLIPQNELNLPPGSDPRRHLQPGSTIDVVLLRRDQSGKARYSAKAVEAAQERKAFNNFREGKRKGGKKGSLGSLGDLFAGIDLSRAK